tara:strand:- start:83 stop:430 length:348 start_codon:yes stop_codon:yes gene_type:complete
MKITRRQLRRIIKEETARVINEYRPNTASGNIAPPRDSNWSQFAAELDIGVLDLDEIAYELGFADFYDMDTSITPRVLAKRDPERFVAAARAHSLKADVMDDNQILSVAEMTGMM